MFNPKSLMNAAKTGSKELSSSHSKVQGTYLKKLRSIDFKGKSAQNSTADYFTSAHDNMFVDNLKIFSKK